MARIAEGSGAVVRCLAIGAAVACLNVAVAAAQAPSADILTYTGADRTERLIAGAKREGQVTYYSAMIVNQALRPLTAAFQKKYPFIKMTFWRADSEDIQTRMSVEVRANKLVVDIAEGTGIGELAVRAGMAQEAWSPELASIPEYMRDPRKLWMPTRMSYFGVAYNTRLVPAASARRPTRICSTRNGRARWCGRC
jgi:iron(III) transport system substrate-binding protein